DGSAVLALAASGENRFIVGDSESPTARHIRDVNWRLDLVGVRDQFTSLWIVPARGGKPRKLTEPRYEVAQAFWSPDGKRIGFVADLRPEAAVVEEPQAWAISTRGGRPSKLAELKGEIVVGAWSPRGRLALLGLDNRKPGGWENIGLWVKEGSSLRRLGKELDRTFWGAIVTDLQDFGARFPPPLIWLDDENVVCLVSDRGSCVPYRFGLDGAVERLVERDDPFCAWLAEGGGCIATIATIDGRAAEVCAVEDGELRQLSRNGRRR